MEEPPPSNDDDRRDAAEADAEDCGSESNTLDSVSGFSSASSTVPPEPFRPLFEASLTGDVSKDGDVVTYALRAVKTHGDGKVYAVKRQYEDFEYLHHCLTTTNPTPGLITPPLPPKPGITSEMAEAKSRRQLGSDSKTMIGDEFDRDCGRLEAYLNLMLAHPTYGTDVSLEKFLTEKEALPRAKVKKGMFVRLSSTLESRKEGHKDCDEFFQTERDFVAKCCVATKATSAAFNDMVFARQRLCGLLSHLATAVVAAARNGGAFDEAGTRVSSAFSHALEGTKLCYEAQCCSEQTTLGPYLELYSRYLAAEKDMLLRRTCLLMEYESSNCAVGKAKPHKLDAAVQAKQAAEKAFETCSDVARQEIKRFHRRRVSEFARNLARYAEEELKTSRDVCSVLTLALADVKGVQVEPSAAVCGEE